METLIKINNQSAGRDKIARLLQYLSRVLWNRLQLQHKGSVNGFKNLEFQLSTFRKLLRFGKCVDVFYSIVPLLDHKDATVRHTLILSKIATSLFLLGDHLLWLGRADVYNVDTDKWANISNKYWLYSITMNLVRDFYELVCIIKSERKSIVPRNGITKISDFYWILIGTLNIIQSNRSVMIDTIKNGCDFFIPLSALGHVKLSAGTIGWLGVVSSIAGLIVLIDPKIKLSPS